MHRVHVHAEGRERVLVLDSMALQNTARAREINVSRTIRWSKGTLSHLQQFTVDACNMTVCTVSCCYRCGCLLRHRCLSNFATGLA
jgi:hypothetical protein